MGVGATRFNTDLVRSSTVFGFIRFIQVIFSAAQTTSLGGTWEKPFETQTNVSLCNRVSLVVGNRNCCSRGLAFQVGHVQKGKILQRHLNLWTLLSAAALLRLIIPIINYYHYFSFIHFLWWTLTDFQSKSQSEVRPLRRHAWLTSQFFFSLNGLHKHF